MRLQNGFDYKCAEFIKRTKRLEAWNSSELIVPSESFSARRLCFGPPFDINLGWILEKVIKMGCVD